MTATGVGGFFYCKNKEKGEKKHLMSAMLTFFVPIFGQIIARMTSFNMTFSHWWLLLPFFWLPPFSIVPAYFVYNGMSIC